MTGVPAHGFVPRLLAEAFPFHVAVDRAGVVLSIGEALGRILPALVPGRPLTDVLAVATPAGIVLDGTLTGHERSLFLLRSPDGALTLRGQVVVDEPGVAYFLGSPWVTDAGQLATLGLTLADFAAHDAAGDVLMLVQGHAVALRDAEQVTGELQRAAEESARLADADRDLAAELRVSERRELEEQLHHQARHDPLTGLGNRAALEERAVQVVDSAGADAPVAVLLLDLDHFKDVNDALGHACGDELLRHVAAGLRRGSRGRGELFRLGGDEFVALLPGLRSPSDGTGDMGAADFAEEIGRRVLQAVRGPFAVAGMEITVEGSVGIALAPQHGSDLGTLLRHADAAMYDAKRAGTGVVVWQESVPYVSTGELTLLAELRRAMRAGDLRVHYQPLVSARTGRTEAVEALVRWQHPDLGLLAPAAFLPLAERSSCIAELTDWVLDTALAQLADWRGVARNLCMSVNLSARLLVDTDLPGRVAAALLRHGVPADALTLEVTESAVASSPERAADLLGQLHALGVRLSVDDFGTGYTSLAMLAGSPFTELKVDRAFVAASTTDDARAAITRSMAELAQRLGMQVVGEGVEDGPSRELLTAWGYDLLQGYLFSRPLEAAEVTPLLTTELPAAPRATATVRQTPRPRIPAPRVPPDEQPRLAAVAALAPMDADAVAALDEVVLLASQACDVPVALVNVVEAEHVRVAARLGLDAAELPREHAFCAHVLEGGTLQIPDTRGDLRFATNPFVTPTDGFRFYAGAPLLTPNGHVLGTLCVLDRRPRRLHELQRRVLERLARTASSLLQRHGGDQPLR